MKLQTLTLLVVVSLVGCSALSKLPALIPGMADKGISVDAQIGDRENELALGGARGTGDIRAEDDATVNVTTSTSDAQIEKAGTVIIKNYDPWMLLALLAVITLFVPSPWGSIKRLFRWRRHTPQPTSTKGSEQKKR